MNSVDVIGFLLQPSRLCLKFTLNLLVSLFVNMIIQNVVGLGQGTVNYILAVIWVNEIFTLTM